MGSAYLKEGAMFIAGLVQAGMSLGKIRLVKAPFTPSPLMTKAALLAIEADYDGYASVTTTTWVDPYFDPAGGATIITGTKVFTFDSGAPLSGPNTIYGFWVEDAAGDVVVASTLDTPVDMTEDGDALPLNVALNYGAAA